MAKKIITLGPNAIRKLASFMEDYRKRMGNRARFDWPESQLDPSPYGNVVKTPPGGISAASGTTMGSADCQVWDPIDGVLLEGAGTPVTVYNTEPKNFPGDTFVLVRRTMRGPWVADRCCAVTEQSFVGGDAPLWTTDIVTYDPPDNIGIVNLSSTVPVTFHGAPIEDDRAVIWYNAGPEPITFPHESTTNTTAIERWYVPGGGSFVLMPGGSIETWHDPLRDRNVVLTMTSGIPVTTTGAGTGQTVSGGLTSSVTNTETDEDETVFTIRHLTSNTPTTGFGTSYGFDLQNAAASVMTAGLLSVSWVTATAGSEASAASISVMSGGALTQALSVDSPGVVRMPEAGTPATPSAGDGVMWFDSDGHLNSMGDDGVPHDLTDTGTGTGVASWDKVASLTDADLTAAATQQDMTVYSLPARTSLLGAQLITKTAGGGVGLTTLTYTVRVNASNYGSPGDGKTANNIDGKVTGFDFGRLIWSNTAATGIEIRFNSTGINLSAVVGGEWEVHLLLATLEA